uniref:Uncharacterized protein n=1 Tax=Trypanosoma congolense (strain IL3000) TaxID=1068625 RepID=G0UP27_TRYCI|nr:conserved hypothetical protein [Trypanosoma congolense IL3000]
MLFFFVQVGVPRVGLDIFPGRSVLRSVMAPHSEVKVVDRSAGETEPGTPCRTQFRHADYESDRRSIAMWRQAQLNNIIMKEEQDAVVSRADHRNMVKQLLYVAYNYDPHNRSNAAKWHALMQAADDEFDAADSTYPFEADPYQRVLTNLSSMMLWSCDLRNWSYGYCANALVKCHQYQREVLQKLKATGKLFLS